MLDIELFREEPDAYRPLPTRLIGETESFYRFEADAPGLSLFVISTESPIFETQRPSVVSTNTTTGTVVATVSVANVGSQSGTYTAQLTGGGEVLGANSTEIPSGVSTTVRVSATVSGDAPVSLTLANESVGTFDPAPAASTTTPNEDVSGQDTTESESTRADTPSGGPGPLTVIGILVLLGGGLLVVLALRRRNG
jgi:hypothetical protein